MRWLMTLLPRTLTYFFNQKIPWLYKLILLLPVLWYLTPVARLANALPLLGLLDAFTIILVTLALFTSACSRYLQSKARKEKVSEASETVDGVARPAARPVEIIEGEYYVIDHSQSEPQPRKKAS